MKTSKLLFWALFGCAIVSSCNTRKACINMTESREIVSDESTTANTIYGKVQGYLDGDVYTFKGIQYAKAARFMPPVFPDKIDSTRICRIYGPKAPQGENLKWRMQESDYDFAFQFNLEPMDEENCLVLNVWSKGINDGKKRPVFVWFHGGGFSSGSGIDLPCYEGRALAKKGDIVVVTINHRLNILGFTDLRGLGGKYSESVNLGMQDIVKSLEWIKSNIENFGGDPSNVTIGGQSGGGGKVSNTMAMPSAHGLFQRAIVQSGSNMPYGSNDETKAYGLEFARQLGVTAENADKLNDFTYEQLVEASHKAMQKTKGVGFGGQLPTLDGKYITEAPIAPELSKNIPLLVGTNLYEFSYGVAKPGISMKDVKKKLSERMGEEEANSFIEEYKKVFPNMETRDILDTDFFFRPGAVAQANAKSALNGAKVYMYLFTWKPKGCDAGACHGMELPFMFNNIDKQRAMTRATEDAYKLSDIMSSSWIQFIKTGDPNIKEMPTWEAYNEQNGAVMLIDNKCHMEHNHDKNLLKYKSTRPF